MHVCVTAVLKTSDLIPVLSVSETMQCQANYSIQHINIGSGGGVFLDFFVVIVVFS